MEANFKGITEKDHLLILGKDGQVGQALARLDWPYKVTALGRSSLDLTKEGQIYEVITGLRPTIIINAAAYTAVDKAESEPDIAFAINAKAPFTMCEALKDIGGRLIHFSTDYVYGGDLSRPFIESDEPNPLGVYAKSKLEGDIAVLNHEVPTIVLRTSWVYSAMGHNFVKTMLRLSQTRDKITVVNDQHGCPTYAPDIAEAVFQILKNASKQADWNQVYHCTNQGSTTWYEFAKTIFELADISIQVEPIQTSMYPTPARRPSNSILNGDKLHTHFGLELRLWVEALKACLDQLGLLAK